MGYDTQYTLEIVEAPEGTDFEAFFESLKTTDIGICPGCRCPRDIQDESRSTCAHCAHTPSYPLSESAFASLVWLDGSGEFAGFGEETRWYDWEEDMMAMSRIFPDFIFCLHGDGEESPDYWRAYFQNGKGWTCDGVVVYPEFKKEFLA